MKRSIEVDMSPRAIDLRLREVAQLYKLGQSIARARPLGKPYATQTARTSSLAADKPRQP